MKTLLFFLLITGCGKAVNHSKRDFSLSPLQTKKNEVNNGQSIPQSLRFKTSHHQISFKASYEVSHPFFESTPEVHRYHPFEHSFIYPEALYQLDTPIPPEMNLYLHDQGKIILIDPDNFKIGIETLERISIKKSYLALHFKKDLNEQMLAIKNYQQSETIIWKGSIEDYLKKMNLTASLLTLDEILHSPGERDEEWWLKKDSPASYKIIFTSLSELTESFHQSYQYEKTGLKRKNGKGSKITISNAPFVYLSAQRTLQKQVTRRFTKTFYTHNGDLPYGCSFVEAQAKKMTPDSLKPEEIQELLNLPSPLGKWSEHGLNTINLELADLTTGFFKVGLITRECRSSQGPPIKFHQANKEKELELVIESYVRKE